MSPVAEPIQHTTTKFGFLFQASNRMASDLPSAYTDLIIPLTKDSCCGYCFARPGDMEEPRALPCGHAACTECIIVDNRRLDLQCKICK